MSVDSIEMWHKRARPNPTDKDFNVQLGCHFEEIVEMLDALGDCCVDQRQSSERVLGIDLAADEVRSMKHEPN